MALHIEDDICGMSLADARLFRAVSAGKHKKVLQILDPGLMESMFFGKPDVNCASQADGRTCLMEALLNEDEQMLAILLAAGADLDTRDDIGRTVLHMAVHRNSARNLSLLLKRAPHLLEEEHRFKKTPLWLASHLCNAKAVEILIRAGADYNRCDGEYNVRPINLWPEVKTIVARLQRQGHVPVPTPEILPAR